MIYSHEVEQMCTVAQGVNHGAAPIPEEAKWVKSKEIKDISGLTHGIGWCAPQQGAGAAVGQHVHAALHGGAAPRGIAVLVGQRTPVAAGQSVEHGTDEAAPGGFAGFVGGADDIQAGAQVQLLLLQPAVGGVQVQKFQGAVSFRGNITGEYITVV